MECYEAWMLLLLHLYLKYIDEIRLDFTVSPIFTFPDLKRWFKMLYFFIGSHPNNDHVFGHVECGYICYIENVYMCLFNHGH